MGFFTRMAAGKKEKENHQSIEVALPTMTSSSSAAVEKTVPIQRVIRSALWGFFCGDALAAPTHWFYGGLPQVLSIYGKPIDDYTKPAWNLPGSILNKSNLSGGGRQTYSSSKEGDKTIIGNVINHGKAELWSPNQSIHYHATLEQGENTLEAQLARHVWMKDRPTAQAYVDFMTRPGSHSDTYASTCHRMFFANLVYRKLPLSECPDNDSHNVDTIDGLVLPTISALRVALDADSSSVQQAMQEARKTAALTRKSKVLEEYSAAWGRLVYNVVVQASHGHNVIAKEAHTMAQSLGLRQPRKRQREEMTACYLSSAVPVLLDNLVKYSDPSSSTSDALLENANTGGENVHKGSLLGAVLGAVFPLEDVWKKNLHDSDGISADIANFVSSETEQDDVKKSVNNFGQGDL